MTYRTTEAQHDALAGLFAAEQGHKLYIEHDFSTGRVHVERVDRGAAWDIDRDGTVIVSAEFRLS